MINSANPINSMNSINSSNSTNSIKLNKTHLLVDKLVCYAMFTEESDKYVFPKGGEACLGA